MAMTLGETHADLTIRAAAGEFGIRREAVDYFVSVAPISVTPLTAILDDMTLVRFEYKTREYADGARKDYLFVSVLGGHYIHQVKADKVNKVTRAAQGADWIAATLND